MFSGCIITRLIFLGRILDLVVSFNSSKTDSTIRRHMKTNFDRNCAFDLDGYLKFGKNINDCKKS